MALKPGARDHTGKVTGSLMFYVAGKASVPQTLDAWRRNIGDLPPLEANYAMRLGSFVEPFLVDEYQKATGAHVEHQQQEVPLPEMPDDVFCTIDGIIMEPEPVITEFKFAGPFMSKEDILWRYYDQVALQLMCTGAERGLLIVGQGTNELIEIECLRDKMYEQELMTRIRAWLICVKALSPPHAMPMPLPPPEKWRRIDLAIDSPNWRDEMLECMQQYSHTREAAHRHDELGKQARALVPDDVGTVLAGDWRIARNKRGNLSIIQRGNGQCPPNSQPAIAR